MSHSFCGIPAQVNDSNNVSPTEVCRTGFGMLSRVIVLGGSCSSETLIKGCNDISRIHITFKSRRLINCTFVETHSLMYEVLDRHFFFGLVVNCE